jgi:hypothetical protein
VPTSRFGSRACGNRRRTCVRAFWLSLDAQPAQDESDVSGCSFAMATTSFPEPSFPTRLASRFCATRKTGAAGWRRGSESNTPRPAGRADNGFEDREGHQAPITLPREKMKSETRAPASARSALVANRLDDGIRLGELPRRLLRVNRLPIDRDLKHAAAGRNQLQRTDVLFEFQQFVRQTDGLRFVVSSRAIFDGNLECHSRILSSAAA